MDSLLWQKIEEYSFDLPISEYGFSTRLAYENKWTINYTQEAILEYKKFMFLAATSTKMVCPSSVVDIVWHQHLIFTKLYKDFCTILGKRIEHIPSTHNKDEKAKFEKSKNATIRLYEANFGNPPSEFWNFDNLFEIFSLDKSKYTFNQYIQRIAVLFIIILFYFQYIMRPVFVEINNPYFIFGYLGLIVLSFLFLNKYNHIFLTDLYNNLPLNSVMQNLKAQELIYMKTGKLENVVHGYVNQLIKDEFVFISLDKKINK